MFTTAPGHFGGTCFSVNNPVISERRPACATLKQARDARATKRILLVAKVHYWKRKSDITAHSSRNSVSAGKFANNTGSRAVA